MKPGDLVVSNCETKTWYQGVVGMLIGFDRFGKFNLTKGDPLVMYGNGQTIRLAGKALEVISEEN